MLTILRSIKLFEPNIRVCAQLINTQIIIPTNSFCTGYAPQALKRKKGKAKETSVSKFTPNHWIRFQFVVYSSNIFLG